MKSFYAFSSGADEEARYAGTADVMCLTHIYNDKMTLMISAVFDVGPCLFRHSQGPILRRWLQTIHKD